VFWRGATRHRSGAAPGENDAFSRARRASKKSVPALTDRLEPCDTAVSAGNPVAPLPVCNALRTPCLNDHLQSMQVNGMTTNH
jgi:hypothetical protein